MDAKPRRRAVLNVRFWDRSMSGGAAELGRFRAFASRRWNVRYLRIRDGWCRREADIVDHEGGAS
jgi:hypothetical protein